MLQAALDHARRAGDALEEAEILAEFVFALPVGPTPVEQASAARRRADADHVEPDLRLDAWALGVRAQLRRCASGSTRLDLSEREEAIHEELGLHWGVFLVASHQWMIEMLAGRPEAAERAIRSRFEVKGLRSGNCFDVEGQLAPGPRPLRAGTVPEARDLADRWAGVEGEDRQAQVTWCGVLARTAAELGDLQEAERIAREGVGIAARGRVQHACGIAGRPRVGVAASG